MRIPLDYYRILGIPIEVSDEQLAEAYSDRSWQLSRQEYSEWVIAARKELLDKAYEILGDSEKRAEYDHLLSNPVDAAESQSPNIASVPRTDESPESFLDFHLPTIEIAPEQFVGALVILQELAEYELILALGYSYLNSPETISPEPENESVNQTIQADITLSLALAHFELSREQWQQEEYEKAALSGQKGLDLLEQTQLFPGIQSEIRTELNKLRPYRILGLLALDESQVRQRLKGMELLQTLLQEREGIDGKGDDRSGLSMDDFLRFIQQLRMHLTTEEQYHLFKAEAQRPSYVAAYFSVYTAIALGFSRKQPSFIVEAQEILRQLEKRQDVHLEQAICALLLGQTEQASAALHQSQDREPLQFIEEKSEGSPDLLPGLCLYGEYWLKHDVFARFRDLVNQEASLKEYFAEEEVQAYLEALPVEEPEVSESSEIEIKQTTGGVMGNTNAESHSFFEERRRTSRQSSRSSRSRTARSEKAYGRSNRGTATLEAPVEFSTSTSALKLENYGEVPTRASLGKGMGATAYSNPSSQPSRRRQAKTVAAPQTHEIQEQNLTSRPRTRRRKTKRKWSLNPKRFLVSMLMLFGVSAVGVLMLKWLNPNRSPLAALEGEQLIVQLNQPPIAIPASNTQIVNQAPTELTSEGAKQVIEQWLSTKAKAFGSDRQIDSLKGILTEPTLSQWQQRAQTLKASNAYWKYEHTVTVKSVSLDPQNRDRAIVEAQVKEVGSYYQNQKLNSQRSYDDNLLVRYNLERQQGQWLIRAIAVIN